MKTTMSVLIDVDVCVAAKAYAAEKGISFSRLVQEVMIDTLNFSPEKKAAMEMRIAKRPGRVVDAQLPTGYAPDPEED